MSYNPQLLPTDSSPYDRHLASFILGRHDIGSLSFFRERSVTDVGNSIAENTNIGKKNSGNRGLKKGVTFQKYVDLYHSEAGFSLQLPNDKDI